MVNNIGIRKLRIRTARNEFTAFVQSRVSYEVYCGALELAIEGSLTAQYFVQGQHYAGIWDKIKDLNISKDLVKLFNQLGDFVGNLKDQFGIGLDKVVKAFKQRDIFALLKAIGFNIQVLFKAVQAGAKAISGGLLKIFEEIHKNGMFQKLQKGLMTVDELLNKYPMIKKVGGIAVAGILLFIWMNMSFTGDASFDLDLGIIILALHGSFSLAQLFGSPSGLMMIALLATGFMGISFPWIGHNVLNLVLALIYTGFTKLKDSQMMKALKSHLELKKI